MIDRIPALERRTRSQPTDPDAWCELAEAQLEAGQRIAALSAVEAATQGTIETPTQWVRIGDLFRELELPDHARQMYLDACRRDRGSALAHGRLGTSLLSTGAAEEAATRFATAAWLEPDRPGHRVELARALIALEAHEAALEQLDQVTVQHPTAVDGWSLLADLHLGRGDSAEAFAALGRGQAAAPGDRRLGLRLARLLLDAGFTAEALSTLEGLYADHRDPDVLDLLADARIRSDDRAGAIDALQKLRIARKDAASAGRLGRLLAADGRHREAVPLLKEAIGATDDPAVMTQLSRSLLNIDRPDDALDVAEDGIARFGETRGLARARDKARAIIDSMDPMLDPGASMDQGIEPASAFAGSLRQFKVPDLLEFLRMNQRTGILRLIAGNRMGEIQLFGGRIAGATISGSTRLGERLIAEGHLTVEALEQAIHHQQTLEGIVPLGEVLVERGHITLDDLRPLLEGQVLEAIGEVLSWEDGRFAFEADDDDPEAPSIMFDTGMMMLEAFRRMDEAAWDAR